MSRGTRRTIFYVLVTLFLFIGTALVLYAQGWRFDFAAWRPEKVGAIFVRPYPASATIAMNGQSVANQANFFSEGTLISGLLPGTYALALRAPGYRNWNENAVVAPAFVTALKNAVLVPSAPAATGTVNVSHFTIASSGAFVTETANGSIALDDGTTTIARGTIVSASANLDTLIYRTPAGTYKWYDFATATTTNLSAALTRGGATPASLAALTIDPTDATLCIARNARRVWLFDAARATTTLVARAATRSAFGAPLAASPARLAWTEYNDITGDSNVVLYDKGGGMLATSSSAIPGHTVQLVWINNSLLGALQDDGSLYTYDVNADGVRKIASDVKQFAAAGDGSAVAALEYQRLEVFPFANTQMYRRVSIPNAATAAEITWYRDADHLFVVYPGSISFLDLEDTALRNLIPIAEGSQLLYNAGKNALYLVNSAQKLERFDFPN